MPTLLKEPPHEKNPRPRPDNPAPFSSLLGIPVLINNRRSRAAPPPSRPRNYHESGDARSSDARIDRDRTETAHFALARNDEPPSRTRLTRNELVALPAGSGTPAGFSKLDIIAGFFIAVMTLGPLFAAFVGRMQG